MLLTKPQQAAFWRLWQRALTECLPQATTAQATALRRDTISRVCGVDSLRLVHPTRHYAALMCEIAQMANDYQAAAYWVQDKERRTAHQVVACARQIGEIVQSPRGWDYCRGVFKQANLPESWEDVTANALSGVFMMLDTHRRRLLRRAGWRGAHHGQPLSYNQSRVYYYDDEGCLQYYDPTPAPV